ncbi:FeoA family protein [Corynebacterium ulceribovis]|uniref:FeoA family protein n=1 Tax=Corynebacterium ulceribovis TaxID=487732 RepID=UPI00035E02C2|nr:FeoA family protein [Corynebacterium ulceribovis]
MTTTVTTADLQVPLRISSINHARLSCQERRRLAELGLRPGCKMQVTQKTAGGGRIIKVSTMRYAVDCQLAGAVNVVADCAHNGCDLRGCNL